MTRGRLAAAGAVAVAVLLTASPALAATPTPTPTSTQTSTTPSATSASAGPVPTPTAPRPTSTAASPQAPDANPPIGGVGPGGVVPGGSRMLERAVVAPIGDPIGGPAVPALPTDVTAAGWALVDLDAGTVLAARDPHGRFQPASILKTLTSLVLLPALPGAAAVPISEQAADTEGSAVGLAPGGTYSADILLTAMLLMSGNDATEALTEAAGGNAAVVAAMNAKVRALGGYDTVVQTPTGLDGWTQLTSAYDMALVLRAAVQQPRLLAYDAITRAFLPAQTVTKDGRPVGQIEMDNQSEDFLSGYPGAVFAKTGFTDAARHTFLCAATRNGRTLGVVMLRAERTPLDQWQQATSLLDWGYALPAGTAPVGTLDDDTVLAAAAARAGAARSAGASSSPTPSGRGTTDPAPTAAAAAGRASGHVDGAVLYGGLAALLVAGLGAVEWRQRRRRLR